MEKQVKMFEEIQKDNRNKRIEAILNYEGFTEQQRALVKKYAGWLQMQSLRLETKRHYLQQLKLLLIDIKKNSLEEITEEDRDNYLKQLNQKFQPRTIFERKKFLINFFEWYYGKKQEEIPLLKDVTMKKPKGTKLPEELLTPEEVKKMVQVADNFRNKCIVMLLYETAARKGEFLQLRNKHIELVNNDYVLITIPMGKTSSRKIPIIYGVPYIKNWLNSHPNRDDPNAPLFVTQGAWLGRALGEDGLKRILQVLSKRAEIKKKVFPHLFRHSRLTELAKELTEQELKKFAGWTAGSSMAATYVHLSGSDVSNKILANAGLIDVALVEKGKSSLQVIKCPRCEKTNPADSKHCDCGFILDLKEVNKVLDMQSTAANKINKFMQPEAMENLFKTMEMLRLEIAELKQDN